MTKSGYLDKLIERELDIVKISKDTRLRMLSKCPFSQRKTKLDIQVGWTNPSPSYRKDINYSNIAEKK